MLHLLYGEKLIAINHTNITVIIIIIMEIQIVEEESQLGLLE